MSSSPTLEAIWIKRSRKGPMDAVVSAQALEDSGLLGNADQGGKRQVTVIEKEVFARIREDLGECLDPVMRRANLLVSGLKLERTNGLILKIGELFLRVEGETKPCERMDQALPGLRKALEPHWGGGVYGIVLNDATISTGDPVSWKSD